jgi:hypothetical protein
MRVAVIALENVFDLGLAALLDAFQTAARTTGSERDA